MSLSDWASIASIISSAAVAVSLAYLGVQAHQNAKHTRALIQAGRVDRLINQMIGYSDADKCAAWLTGNGQEATTEAIKQRQFVLLCFGQAGVMLDAFTQHSEGLLNDEQFNSVRVAYRDWLQAPGFRQFLLRYRTVASSGAPKFSTFLDRLMADPPQQTGV